MKNAILSSFTTNFYTQNTAIGKTIVNISKEILNNNFDFYKSNCVKYKNIKYDNIFYFYATNISIENHIYFMKNNPNANLYWIFNEYTLNLDSKFKKYLIDSQRPLNVITINPYDTVKKIFNNINIDNYIECNINILNYHKYKPIEVTNNNKIYYGFFRKDRLSSYNLINDSNIYLATNKSNMIKYIQNNIKDVKFINTITPDSFNSELRNFKYSIYIEDYKQHSQFDYVNVRFYEALSHSLQPIIDIRCKNTFKLDNYDIPNNWFFETKNDLLNMNLYDIKNINLLQNVIIQKKQEIIDYLKSKILTKT